MLSRETYSFVDPNRARITTDGKLNIIEIEQKVEQINSFTQKPNLSLHLSWIISVHKHSTYKDL